MGKKDFRENVVIITAASYGIGQELARQLANEGAWLVLAARSEERLNEIAGECERSGGKAVAIPTDVGIREQCRNLIQDAVADFGRVDTLINNAGFGVAARFSEMPDLEVFERVMRINFFGSAYCTHYALPYLKAVRGRLVAVSSLRGKFPSATADGYGASKHAMAGFFDSLRVEVAESVMSVTMIYPGWVSTGISSRALDADGEPRGSDSEHEQGAMPVETCARMILRASAKRRRQVIMTLQGKAGLWLRLIVPRLVDEVARRSTE